MSATHYLSDRRKHFIAQDGESPGRLVGPGARRYDKKSSIFGSVALIMQIIKKAVPEFVPGGLRS